jgi:hypothetical protein
MCSHLHLSSVAHVLVSEARQKILKKMSEEEFSADEIWFGNQFRLNESQELEMISLKTMLL